MKKHTRKKTVLMALLAILLGSSCASSVKTQVIGPTDYVLNFLGAVVNVDTAKYSVTSAIGPNTEHPADYGGLSFTYGTFSMTSSTSTLSILYRFINGSLVTLQVNIVNGKPAYKTPLVSIRDSASSFLQRYQSFVSDQSLVSMQNLLESTDITNNASGTVGNLEFDYSASSYSAASTINSFKWSNTINGATFSTFGLSYINNDFYIFGTDKDYVQIGSSQVNMSKTEAMNLALATTKSYSYTVNGVKIANLTYRIDAISAQLLTKAKDKPLVLYPYWMVTLPLADLYPGFVSEIIVEIWADTGQVNAIYPLGIGGDLPPASTPSVSALPSASPEPTITVAPIPTVPPSPTTGSNSTSNEPLSTSALPSQTLIPPPTPSPQITQSPPERDSPKPTSNSPTLTSLTSIIGVVAAVVLAVAAVMWIRRKLGNVHQPST